jgi:hypothetical protein
MSRRVYPVFLVAAALLTVALALFLRGVLRGPTTVHVGGAVEAPYDYPQEHGDVAQTTAEGTLREVTAKYNGAPVQELVARAQPQPGASLLLVRASDGYAFFIGMDEVNENDSLLLAPQGEGDEISYNVVGALNSKAWVRGVSKLTVIGPATLPVSGSLQNPAPYDPDDWQFKMDATRLDLGNGPQKLQGAPLGQVLQAMDPDARAETVLVETNGDTVALPLVEVLGDDDLRIFTLIGEEEVSFALARMSGEVLAAPMLGVEVR